MFFDNLKEKLNKQEKVGDDMEFKPFQSEDEQLPSAKEIAAPEPVAEENHSDNVELKIMHPEKYEDVSDIADCLLDGCTVVLNLDSVSRQDMIRMLDFLNGVTYCKDGEIKNVANTTFIITPHSNVDISDM